MQEEHLTASLGNFLSIPLLEIKSSPATSPDRLRWAGSVTGHTALWQGRGWQRSVGMWWQVTWLAARSTERSNPWRCQLFAGGGCGQTQSKPGADSGVGKSGAPYLNVEVFLRQGEQRH